MVIVVYNVRKINKYYGPNIYQTSTNNYLVEMKNINYEKHLN